jgi:hypothetical protein
MTEEPVHGCASSAQGGSHPHVSGRARVRDGRLGRCGGFPPDRAADARRHISGRCVTKEGKSWPNRPGPGNCLMKTAAH